MTPPVDPRDWPEPEAGADYHVFSPSQVEEYLGCNRKWGFRKIGRVKRAENESANLGSDVHLELENFLSGKSFDFTHPKGAGYIAAAGVHLIPDPSIEGLTEDEIVQRARDVLIETEFRFQSARTKFVWNGRKDLELADSRLIPDLTLPCDSCNGASVFDGESCGQCDGTGEMPISDELAAPAVLDHKSTSGLRWAKTQDDLKWDVQANIYAYALMAERNVSTVDLVWTYYQTKGAKAAKRTHLRVHAPHAMRAFRLIEDVAVDMARALDASKRGLDRDGPPDLLGFVRTLRPNPDACSAYGGCPYQHVCKLSTNERIKASMSQSDSFLDSIKARAEAEDAANGAPVQLPPTCAPTDVPAPSGMPAWLTAQPTVATATVGQVPGLGVTGAAAQIPLSSAPAPAATVPSFAERAATPGANDAGKVTAPAASSIDFSSTPPLAPSSAAPAWPPAASAVEAPALHVQDPGINPPESSLPPPVELPPEPPPPAAERKGKGGRPKGAKNKPKDPTGADAALHTETPEDPAAELAQELLALKTSPDVSVVTLPPTSERVHRTDRELEFPDDGFTLYVDCFPVKGPSDVDDVAEYVARAKKVIAVTDYPDGKGGTVRVADYRYLPYGQGTGALAGAVLAEIAKDQPSHLVVSTGTPEGSIVLSDLIARAAFVVRGHA